MMYFRHYCDQRGWEQPTINSLGADGIPPPRSANPVNSNDNCPENTVPLTADVTVESVGRSSDKTTIVPTESSEADLMSIS